MRVMINALLLIATAFGVAMIPGTSHAQAMKKKGWWTVASAGLGVGASDVRPLLQASGGIRLGQHFLGAGIGYDWYREPATPLFAEYRASFGKKQLMFFYADAGYAFVSDRNRPLTGIYHTTAVNRGGFYGEAGIGFKIPVGRSSGLLLSGGYNRRATEVRDGFTYPCLSPPCEEEFRKYFYDYNRLVARLSWLITR